MGVNIRPPPHRPPFGAKFESSHTNVSKKEPMSKRLTYTISFFFPLKDLWKRSKRSAKAPWGDLVCAFNNHTKLKPDWMIHSKKIQRAVVVFWLVYWTPQRSWNKVKIISTNWPISTEVIKIEQHLWKKIPRKAKAIVTVLFETEIRQIYRLSCEYSQSQRKLNMRA